MNVIAGGRQSGKTSMLLKWAASQPPGTGRIIVTASLNSSMRLLRAARDAGYDVESWQFVSVLEMRDRGAGFMWGVRLTRPALEFALDDADVVLRDLLGAPITIATLTGTAEEMYAHSEAELRAIFESNPESNSTERDRTEPDTTA